MDNEPIIDALGPRFKAVSGDALRALEYLQLPKSASILDVGTGSGNFAVFLAMQGYSVLTGEPGDDTSQYAGRDWAQLATRAGVSDKIKFQLFDASALPFPTASFDAVFFFGVLHHIVEQSRARVFSEALRVTHANGVVVFFEPREEMLQQLWVDDPQHPLAANPAAYLQDPGVRETKLEGGLMDIFIYEKQARRRPLEA